MDDIFRMELDKSETAAPLYQQLADGIARLIADGHLPANSKLPPIRKLAGQAGVNPATVVTAYKHLESKQMAYSRIGSGTFVSPLPVEQAPEPVANLNIRPYHSGINLENAINFANTSLPHEMFPVAAFKRAFDEVLEREKGGAFSYMDIMGHEPLRALLCGYLESCGIKTSVENVQIISGAQQGVDLISKAILRFGDVVFVEKPTFYGAAGAFLSRGGKLVEIPLLEDGMDIAALENYLKLYQPKLIYMTAYFQTPTGVSYSLEKKRRLLELAEQYGAYIIEEDDYYDFHYGAEPLVSLKALDYKNRVIYIKSFSKILMPGLRMGLIVLPKKIRQAVMEAKYTTDHSSSGFMQRAMEYALSLHDALPICVLAGNGILSAGKRLGNAWRADAAVRRGEIPQGAFCGAEISGRTGALREAGGRGQFMAGTAGGRQRGGVLREDAGEKCRADAGQPV